MAYHIVDRFDAFTVDEVLVIRAALATFVAHVETESGFHAVLANALSDEVKASHLEYAGVTI